VGELLWRMRLRSHDTLAHYLQEVLASTSLSLMPRPARTSLEAAARLFPSLVEAATSYVASGLRSPLLTRVPETFPAG